MGGRLSVLMVQSAFSAEDYRDENAFGNRVLGFFEGMSRGTEPGPELVVFPELTGLWLPLLRNRSPRSVAALAAGTVLRRPWQALLSLARGRGLSFAFLSGWRDSFHSWIEPFREAARRHRVYVCPGSAFLPELDWEVATGWHARGPGIYNTSCLISPRGRLLGLTRKVRLTAEERRLGIRPGQAAELLPYQTELGKVGILICLDGFHQEAVARMDRLGCQILVQPSANGKSWQRPPRRGTHISQEEEWLSQGLGSLIQGRESIQLAVNPMSVSEVLGHRDEGRSSAFLNLALGAAARGRGRLPERYRRYPGLCALAGSCDGEQRVMVPARLR
jgi:predicted amidohydrolase